MNSEFVTIAPAIDAFTSMYSPAPSAASAITSSVRLPSVAFSSPPIVSPVLAATDSVAMLSSAASGTIARIERKKSAVCASGRSRSAASTIGTKTSSQSSGVRRIAASSCIEVSPGRNALRAYAPASTPARSSFLVALTGSGARALVSRRASRRTERAYDHAQTIPAALPRARHRRGARAIANRLERTVPAASRNGQSLLRRHRAAGLVLDRNARGQHPRQQRLREHRAVPREERRIARLQVHRHQDPARQSCARRSHGRRRARQEAHRRDRDGDGAGRPGATQHASRRQRRIRSTASCTTATR